jgi:peptide/nickel transport system substrate-binding protein
LSRAPPPGESLAADGTSVDPSRRRLPGSIRTLDHHSRIAAIGRTTQVTPEAKDATMTADRRAPLSSLYSTYRAGGLTRRAFLRQALAAGMALPVALHAIQSLAQTPVAVPAGGTEGRARGEGGELRILQWQAPTALSQHSALGGKDNLAATLVLEPLMSFLPDATLVPRLVTEVPTHENGLLAADNTSVTYTLREGVTWSDGEPFTADDVVFTWQWVTNPDSGATTFDLYSVIAAAEAIDERTVTLTFKNPQPAWYVPFSGSWWGAVLPKHILDGGGQQAYQDFLLKPTGTGPYVVDAFTPNDQVSYVANKNYRDPNKPFFSSVVLKGGGDAASAARAVLETGEYDYAWNLQVEPEVLRQMTGAGQLIATQGASLEQIYINFSDPNTEVDGEFSSLQAPHPFLSDVNVRKAFAASVDREKIVSALYGDAGNVTANILVGIAPLESPNTSFVFNTDEGNRLLDEAGWTRDGDTRAKDGVSMKVAYATTVNQVRQKTQAIVKAGLEAIGVEVQLKQVDAGVYFDSSAGNDQSYMHFSNDLGMSTANIDSPFPLSYMNQWYAGPDNSNVAQKANGWTGQNLSRYVNPDYDAMFEAVRTEIDPEKSAELFIAMNDLLVDDQVVIPVVQRGDFLGVSNRLNADNLATGPFETDYWNIENWVTVE